MFIADVPYIPAQEAPLMVADASAAQGSTQKYDRVIGVCHLSANPYDSTSAQNSLSPPLAVKNYYFNYEEFRIHGAASVSVLKMPEHGKLLDDGGGDYIYLPEKGFLGNDRATLLVEVGGKRVRMEYFFRVMTSVHEGEGADPYADNCPNKASMWKISTLTDVYGNNFITAVNILTPNAVDKGAVVNDPAALSSWLALAQLDGKVADMSGINITFADLPGSAVGQTVGSVNSASASADSGLPTFGATITLDTSAAGHGWYVDANPWDNSEYLATSNPYEWVAREGSGAEGKMDLLSVLLHEYGHALGIEHSMDSHNYMGTTLTPGVRRMPSAEELALMQQLVGQVKEGIAATSDSAPGVPLNPALPLSGGFLAFLGRRRESGFGIQDAFNPQPPAIRPQYAVAANAAFTGLDTPTGWNTLGSVGIMNNAATLNEVSATQTRLSQVFTVNAKDRYLTFTLSGAALDDLTGAPDDAFEAALLDASTGLSLLGGIGLTRSDAFFNLQADGSQNLANCVTCTDNPDGSRTYRVDISGIAAGTVANLSFDLIGFGQSNSRLTLSDVRVSGLPQLQDEAATMLEDGSLAFDPYAQADAQLRPMLAANVVDAPLHGAITVNGDGTFSYTPDLDYFGSDSFTYRLADGPLESNLATVSITLTAVNDAPVAADVQLAANEDTALTITLGAYASDVDSATLTPVIVTGPAHGTLLPISNLS